MGETDSKKKLGRFKLRVSEDDQDVAYVRLPSHPGETCNVERVFLDPRSPPATPRYKQPVALLRDVREREINKAILHYMFQHTGKSEATRGELIGDIDGFLLGDRFQVRGGLPYYPGLDSSLCAPGGAKLSELFHEYYCVFERGVANTAADRFQQFSRINRSELLREVKAFAATFAYKPAATAFSQKEYRNFVEELLKATQDQSDYLTADMVVATFWKWFAAQLAAEKAAKR